MSVRTDAYARERGRARRFADPAKVEPHPPVHTLVPSTCGTCGHTIGFSAEHDPVHDVPRECGRCGSMVAPFELCRPCGERDAAEAERARQARLTGYIPEPAGPEPSDTVSVDERERREASPEYREAKAYALTYTGTFEFMVQMRERLTGPKGVRGPLSPRMVEAILKCKRADEDRARRQAEAEAERQRNQTGRDLSVLPYGRTYAAVDNDSGGVTFLIIDRPDARSRWDGWVFVKQQQGPSEVKLGAQRPGETYVGQWPSLIDRVLADPVAAVARYGLELGVCGVCHAPLTNEDSRAAGIGPVCRTRIAA